MRVFRVENPNGRGPFHSMYSRLRDVVGLEHYEALPTPQEEGLPVLWERTFCGCTNPQDLREKWFPPPTHQSLMEQGFAIVEYDVNDELVRVGNHQVMFYRDMAIEMGRQPL